MHSPHLCAKVSGKYPDPGESGRNITQAVRLEFHPDIRDEFGADGLAKEMGEFFENKILFLDSVAVAQVTLSCAEDFPLQ